MEPAIFCNKPNDQIPEEEWKSIEHRAHGREPYFCKHGMMAPSDRIRDIIAKDAKVLADLGVTPLQLASAMSILIKEAIKSAKKDREENKTHTKQCISVYPGKTMETEAYYVEAYGMTFVAMEVAWMGSQECPFKNRALDSAYHGYSYGSVDYLFVKTPQEPAHDNDKAVSEGERLQFSSLLIHMLAMHGFLEGEQLRDPSGHESDDSDDEHVVPLMKNPWRVDPVHACRFLKPIIDTLPPEGSADALRSYISHK